MTASTAARAARAFDERSIPAIATIGGVVDRTRRGRLDSTIARGACDRIDGRLDDRVASDDRDRRLLAAPDTGGAEDAHVGKCEVFERFAQRLRACNAHDSVSQTRTVIAAARRIVVDDVEVVVERRDLVHFRHREAHFLRERDEVRGREAAVAVLDAMQMLDQQVATTRCVAEQRPHLAPAPPGRPDALSQSRACRVGRADATCRRSQTCSRRAR